MVNAAKRDVPGDTEGQQEKLIFSGICSRSAYQTSLKKKIYLKNWERYASRSGCMKHMKGRHCGLLLIAEADVEVTGLCIEQTGFAKLGLVNHPF